MKRATSHLRWCRLALLSPPVVGTSLLKSRTHREAPHSLSQAGTLSSTAEPLQAQGPLIYATGQRKKPGCTQRCVRTTQPMRDQNTIWQNPKPHRRVGLNYNQTVCRDLTSLGQVSTQDAFHTDSREGWCGSPEIGHPGADNFLVSSHCIHRTGRGRDW